MCNQRFRNALIALLTLRNVDGISLGKKFDGQPEYMPHKSGVGADRQLSPYFKKADGL